MASGGSAARRSGTSRSPRSRRRRSGRRSFTEPPGCTTAVTPASVRVSRPSGKGKNASEAAAAPFARSWALTTASWAAATRDCWPAPMPTAVPSRAMTTAFDDVRPHTRQAMTRSRSSSSVGTLVVATSHVAARRTNSSGSWTSTSSPIVRSECVGAAGAAAVSSRVARRRATRSAVADSVMPAAMITSAWGPSAIALASASSIVPVTANTPPNALSSSAPSARRKASVSSGATAAPQALACLTSTAAGRPVSCASSWASRHAASASKRLR